MQTLAGLLAKHTLAVSFSTIPEENVMWAKVRVFDVIGCILAGIRGANMSAVLRTVQESGGKPLSTVFHLWEKTSPSWAAFANSLLARSFDYEPVGPYVGGVPYPAHISGTSIPTALAVAEVVGASGKDMLAALIVGEDVAARLVGASRFDLGKGWDNTGTSNAFGACAIAGRLYGLTSEQLTNAFGLTLSFLGGTLQTLYEAADSFKLPQGLSSFAGIMSAELAMRGMKGPLRALEGDYGYFRMYCNAVDYAEITSRLAEEFCCDQVLKPYPCCRANHGAVDCALEVHSKMNVRDIEQIRSIRIYVPPRVKKMFVNRSYGSGRDPQVDAAFNIRYCVAKSLLKGRLTIWEFTPEELSDSLTGRLAERIELVASDFSGEPKAASLEVHFACGEVIKAHCTVPKGDRKFNSLREEEIIKKCATNLEFAGFRPESAERLWELSMELEEFAKIEDFVNEIRCGLK